MTIPTLRFDESTLNSIDQYASCAEKAALESMVAHGIATASDSQGSGNDLAFAIMSANDYQPLTMRPNEKVMLNTRACRRKQADWFAGRAASHLALKQLGADDAAPVLRGDVGEPIWPDGFSGSITHCYPWSIAVAAKSSDQPLAIGIDLESSDRMKRADPHGIVDLICREQEREWVQRGPDFSERLTIVFAAKEALYKSLYPICKRYIGFKEVELRWRPYASRFRAEFIAALATDLACLHEHDILCQQYKQWFFACSIHGIA